MFPKRAYLSALFLVAVCTLAVVLPAVAQEKIITFTKDINVVPENSNSNTNVRVRLGVDRTRVKQGDTVTVSFETDKDCYLTLLDLGTSGKITRLWPNQFSGADNFVKANQKYTFPSSSDRFRFKVSGPDGIERIVALASTEANKIVKEEEFNDYQGGFKTYNKNLKDLVVEASRRAESLSDSVKWGTGEVKLVIGNVPDGGRITSRNIYLVSLGAATAGLKYCEDDAKGVAQLLGKKLGIPAENTRVLLGQQASRAGFVDSLRWLADKTQPEDLVFVYFSGHGTLIPDEPPARHDDGLSAAFVCYTTKDSLRIEDPDLKNVLLVGHEFAGLMKNVPARRRLFVVDSCHSGSIHKEVLSNLVPKYLPLLSSAQIKGLQIRADRAATPARVGEERSEAGRYAELTSFKETLAAACAKPELSYEDRSKRSGLFTYWFLNTINGGAGDLRQAFDATRGKVEDETRAAGLQQSPQLTDQSDLAKDIKFSRD